MVECSPGTPFFQLSLSREGMGYAPWAVEQSLEKESIKMAKTFMSATKSEGGEAAEFDYILSPSVAGFLYPLFVPALVFLAPFILVSIFPNLLTGIDNGLRRAGRLQTDDRGPRARVLLLFGARTGRP